MIDRRRPAIPWVRSAHWLRGCLWLCSLLLGISVGPAARAATLSGQVINDVNGNGVIDAGDAPLANVHMELLTGATRGAEIQQVITDATGSYTFVDVSPGTYRIVPAVPLGDVATAAFPGPGAAVLSPTSIRITVTDDETVPGNNFLFHVSALPTATGSIAGAVLRDDNSDGVPDTGDTPIAGATILLQTQAGTTINSTTTDLSGAFSFNSLSPGIYDVVQLVPANVTAIAAFAGAGAAALSATTIQVNSAGGASTNNIFLDRSTVVSPTVGTISGSVLQDVDGNGVIDAGDQPLQGVLIELFTQTGTFINQTVTDVNGAYAFGNLPPGFYQVVEVVPLGELPVAAFPGPNGSLINPTALLVTAAENVNAGNNNFLLQAALPQSGIISGSVIQDTDGNNLVDVPPDTALAGVIVQLQTAGGVFLRQTTTDVNGAWAFSGLTSGTYRVVHLAPLNFVNVAAFPGPGGIALSPTTLQFAFSGGVSGNNNFLDRSTVVSPTVGIISGSVFRDVDGNGVLTVPPDVPIPGVTVQLFTSLGTFIALSTTDVNGAWAFINVPPGSYLVTQIVPAGYTAQSPTTLAVTAVAGTNQGNNNFLDLLSGVTSGTNTISGFAIEDLNQNGIADEEPGLAGMVVTLQDSTGTVIGSVTTDITGLFSFTGLAGGTYTLTATPPAGRTNTNVLPGQGGIRVNASTIQVTTVPGVTSYAGQLFLAGP